MTNDTTYFGKTNFRAGARIFGIKNADRRQHMYVVGKTGTGKSVLLKNMAIQDIKNGHGLAVVDPHGEFVEEVLAAVPPERVKDVVYFNPCDSEYSIGFNVLESTDPKYRHLVASGLMGIFTKIWANVWSSRMEYILNNCILALVETPGTTLLSIPRILVDKDYREKILDNVTDPVVKSFWIHEYAAYNDRFRSEAIAPIQNKVGQFLSTPLIRNIVGQSKSTLDIDDVMDSGKILLVNVSKGRIGEDNSALLGAMIITKLQLAAMGRVKISEENRRDFFLYVDEFQNFATKSFADILSEARKYRLNLTIAHQYTGQLITELDTTVRDAVFGNCGTMIVFRVGAGDAELLEPEFTPEFEQQDLVNLPNFHAYIKLMCNGVTSRPFSAATLPPIKVDRSEGVMEAIIKKTRENYARPRAEVEEEMNTWASSIDLAPATPAGKKRAQAKEEIQRLEFSGPKEGVFSPHLSKLDIEFDVTTSVPQKGSRRDNRTGPHKDVRHNASRNNGSAALQKTPALPQNDNSSAPPRDNSSTPPRGAPTRPPRFGASMRQKPAGRSTSSGGAPLKQASLSELLKPQRTAKKEEHEKKEVDITALRDALSNSLSQAGQKQAASEKSTIEHERGGARHGQVEKGKSNFFNAPPPASVSDDDDDDVDYKDRDRRIG